MGILLGLAVALLLAGCAITPDDTSMNRIYQSLYHRDHPEYGRPVTMAEQRPDFTGTHPAPSRAAEDAWKTDVKACSDGLDQEPRDPKQSLSEFSRQYRHKLWDCLWAKGWRWDRDP